MASLLAFGLCAVWASWRSGDLWPLVLLPVLAAIGWLWLRRPVRRRRLHRTPFPPAWRSFIEAQVPFYRSLSGEARRRFEDDVRFVLAEHRFEGVDGVVPTDELRLLVAAGAAMLLHGRPSWELPAGHTVLFYPGSFDESWAVEAGAPILGQAMGQGPLIFSVPALLRGFSDPEDADNVALHELAHALDFENAHADGVPAGLATRAAERWLRLLDAERERVLTGESPLRPYAAASEAELFAVAVEHFFERPAELRDRSPALYEALASFLAQDPAARR